MLQLVKNNILDYQTDLIGIKSQSGAGDMVPEVSPHHHGSSSEIQTMWSKRESVFGRTLGSLRSAQHKYGRRCDKKKMTQVSMEIAASACPQAAFDYMAIILVEDKFPDGAALFGTTR